MDIKKITTQGELQQVVDMKDIQTLIMSRLKNPKEYKAELLDDLKYLSSRYAVLLNRKVMGQWTKFKICQLFAQVVDALRSIGEEIIVPLSDNKVYESPYWQCYRESQTYLKEPEEVLIEKPVEKQITFYKKDKDQQIVFGVIYSPDEIDSQDDMAHAEDIQKASYKFMEGDQHIKIYHDGHPIKAKVIESFIAPIDYSMIDISGVSQHIKKGSWLLGVKIYNKDVWNMVKNGSLLGFSMGGRAKIQ